MNTVIQVESLSKSYRLGTIGGGTLRADVSRWLAKWRGKPDPNLKIGQEHHARFVGKEFWALQDVNFEVKQGEILGVIGRNGAGKSTLLKILSRVTAPTSGVVRVKGRIASLLEVGTGFHPELTGRENVFLNGAILGMTRGEIRKKFDEIVAFAEVEKFIDTPVKRYSSGMYVRLAFAVAAHLEPEILIVDEVLAVGDVEFQNKCLGKMQSVSREEGRTILFVSHNISAVQMLCTQAMYLSGGRVGSIGNVDEHVAIYLQDVKRRDPASDLEPVHAGKTLKICKLTLSSSTINSGDELGLQILLQSGSLARLTDLAILIFSANGIRVAVLDLRSNGKPVTILPGSTAGVRCQIKSLPLIEGEYQVGLYVKTDDFDDNLMGLADFMVTKVYPANGVIPYAAAHRGIVELNFTTEIVND